MFIRSSIFGDYLGLSSWGRFFQTIVCPRYVGWLTWYLLTHNYWLLGLQPTQIVWVGLQTWASSWGYSAPWKKSYDKPRQHIKKERNDFANKGPPSQSYGFSSSHVWMWEWSQKESWAPKNWWLWTVVLEKTLESSVDCKEIWPVHPQGS